MNRSTVPFLAVRSCCLTLAAAASLATAAIADDGAAAATAQTQADVSAAEARVAAERAEVLAQYLIGPDAAASLGCNIAWQVRVPLQKGGSLRLVESSPSAVLALDNMNDLSLVRPESGSRAWTASAADPIDRVTGLGVFEFKSSAESDARRVAVMTDARFYALGFDSGATLARGRFRHVPNTVPVQRGNFFVYGTSSGMTSWFNCATMNDSRSAVVDAFRVASPVVASPRIGSGVVVTGSSSGGVAALDADSGRLYWNRTLLGPVTASPEIAGGVVFIASDDQYLYAFDVASGAPLWKYFTQTPLKTSPFAAGELVLQDVPGEGLVALTQKPESQPGGEVRWRRESVAGSPIGMLGGDVLFWCAKGRMATVISLKDGQTVRTIELSSVEHLAADTIETGGFVAWSADGRVERLSPRQTAAGN
jgi:hypothetical protein